MSLVLFIREGVIHLRKPDNNEDDEDNDDDDHYRTVPHCIASLHLKRPESEYRMNGPHLCMYIKSRERVQGIQGVQGDDTTYTQDYVKGSVGENSIAFLIKFKNG